MEDKICRICLEPDVDVFAPCLCKGTIKWVHKSCFNEWRLKNEHAYYSCQTCNVKYQFQFQYWIAFRDLFIIPFILLLISECIGLLYYGCITQCEVNKVQIIAVGSFIIFFTVGLFSFFHAGNVLDLNAQDVNPGSVLIFVVFMIGFGVVASYKMLQQRVM